MDWNDVKKDVTSLGVQTFGRTMIFKPKTGSPVTITGIATRDHVEVQMGNSLPVSKNKLVADVDLSEFPSTPVAGDKITLDTVDYLISDCQEDGGGGARLVLTKSP